MSSRISGGRVQLKAGTLYAALERLTAERLIELGHDELVKARLRRYYRQADEGAGRLSIETARLKANVLAAESRLRTSRQAGRAGGPA